jgi:hypothetical protein
MSCLEDAFFPKTSAVDGGFFDRLQRLERALRVPESSGAYLTDRLSCLERISEGMATNATSHGGQFEARLAFLEEFFHGEERDGRSGDGVIPRLAILEKELGVPPEPSASADVSVRITTLEDIVRSRPPHLFGV